MSWGSILKKRAWVFCLPVCLMTFHLEAAMLYQMNLEFIENDHFPFKSLEIEGDSLDFEILFEDETVEYTYDNLPPLTTLKKLSIKAPHATLRLIQKNDECLSQDVDSLSFVFESSLHNSRRLFSVEIKSFLPNILKVVEEAPRTFYDLFALIGKHCLFGKPKFQLNANVCLNENYYQHRWVEESNYEDLNADCAIEFSINKFLRLTLGSLANRTQVTWEIYSKNNKGFPNLERIMKSLHALNKIYLDCHPENAEQEMIKHFLVYASLTVDLVAPFLDLQGVHQTLTGSFDYETTDDYISNLQAITICSLIGNQGTWRIGGSNAIDYSADKETHSWKTAFTCFYTYTIFPLIIDWTKDKIFTLFDQIYDFFSPAKDHFVDSALKKLLDYLDVIETVDEEGHIYLEVERQSDGSIQICD